MYWHIHDVRVNLWGIVMLIMFEIVNTLSHIQLMWLRRTLMRANHISWIHAQDRTINGWWVECCLKDFSHACLLSFHILSISLMWRKKRFSFKITNMTSNQRRRRRAEQSVDAIHISLSGPWETEVPEKETVYVRAQVALRNPPDSVTIRTRKEDGQTASNSQIYYHCCEIEC